MIEFLLLENKHSGLGFVRNNFSEVFLVPNSCPRGNPAKNRVKSLGTLKAGQTAVCRTGRHSRGHCVVPLAPDIGIYSCFLGDGCH